MDLAVFVPGIFGSKLELPSTKPPEEVWPPTWQEVKLSGYQRIEKLMRDDLVPSGLIMSICHVQFYAPFIQFLKASGFTATGTEKRLLEVPYDWRRDIFDCAEYLAAQIDKNSAGVDKIYLLGHSMGGLVCRVLLESGKYEKRPWFNKIRTYYALAVPHVGAPLALGRVLGVDSALGVSKEDFKRISNDPRYPSGYQLIPAPGENVCWDQSAYSRLESVDIYDKRQADRLGLNEKQLKKTKKLHNLLSKYKTPKQVRYIALGATGHKTISRVNVFAPSRRERFDHNQTVLTKSKDAGDGTVPIYSSLALKNQRQVVIEKHSTAFDADAFRALFRRTMGLSNETVLAGKVDGSISFDISTNMTIYSITDIVEVVIAVKNGDNSIEDSAMLNELLGSVKVNKISETTGKIEGDDISEMKVSYTGPGISKLTIKLDPFGVEGLYRIQFSSELGVSRPTNIAVGGPGT